jgi:hypothetical protein
MHQRERDHHVGARLEGMTVNLDRRTRPAEAGERRGRSLRVSSRIPRRNSEPRGSARYASARPAVRVSRSSRAESRAGVEQLALGRLRLYPLDVTVDRPRELTHEVGFDPRRRRFREIDPRRVRKYSDA